MGVSARWTARTRGGLLALLAILTAACETPNMGELCERSQQCQGGGVCLAGACSGYECTSDGDCSNALVCGSVAGIHACMTACDSDADCPGEQACTEVDRSATTDDGTAWYCM